MLSLECKSLFTIFIDDESNRRPLSKVEYQFKNEEHEFELLPHGNSAKALKTDTKQSLPPYNPTQRSTKALLIKSSKTAPPRKVFQEVSKEFGDLTACRSVGSLPRNIKQIYNINNINSMSFIFFDNSVK